MTALFSVTDLVVRRRIGPLRSIEPVAGVSFTIDRGGSFGVVGESGCGKTTLARALVGLHPATSGHIELAGREITHLKGEARRLSRRDIQIVFQDPVGSLNPRRRAVDIVAEPLRVWGDKPRDQWGEIVSDVLASVGLDRDQIGDRRPRELSGGQSQRVSIARALALEPKVLICDEVVSALDVSAQAQVLNYLAQLRTERGLSLLFISHDLAAVNYVCTHVAVMYLGKLCEVGPRRRIFGQPAHPYTASLVAAARKDLSVVRQGLLKDGEVPSFLDPPTGCRFRLRCGRAQEICAHEEPVLHEVEPDRSVACHFPLVAPEPPSTPGPPGAESDPDAAGPPGRPYAAMEP